MALRRSIALGERAGSPVLAAQARMKLAYVLVQRGRAGAALAEVDAALPELAGVAQARASAQRAFILHQVGRLDEALATHNRAILALSGGGDLLGAQRALTNRALLHTDRYAFAAAEADLLESQRLAGQLGLGLPLGIIAENLSLVEGLRGNIPAALAHLQRAEEIIESHRAAVGTVLRDRAELLLSAGLAAEARAAAQRAVAACRREHRLLKVPEVRLLLAQAAALERDWPAALAQARLAARELAAQHRPEWAALARFEVLRATLESPGPQRRVRRGDAEAVVDAVTRAGWPAVALEARLLAGRLALRRGDREAGTQWLQRAASAAGRRSPALVRARAGYASALLRHAAGDPLAAARAARAGLTVLDEHAAAMGAADLRAHSAVYRRELAELGLRIALDGGRPRQVFEWAERGRASRLLPRPARPPEDPVLAQLLSRLRATAAEVEQLRHAGRGPGGLLARQAELERRVRDHTRQWAGAPNGQPAARAPVRPGELGHALGDRALVEFVDLDGTMRALTLVRGRLRLHLLGDTATVAGLVQRLPFALHRMARERGDQRSQLAAGALLRHAAARLDELLLRPLPELGDWPLVVVPTGVLHSLPWASLPSCTGRPVTVAPSATLWHAGGRPMEDRGRRQVTQGGALAASAASQAGSGVARPAASTPDAAGSAVAGLRVAVAAGPRLPGAEREAHAVAEIHRTTALVGGAATVEAVLDALQSAGIAHIAAHGRLTAENPLFSQIQLADGPLMVYDLEQLDQVPHTVVLAACDSGRAAIPTGDELLGLGATLVSRGAAHLVGSVLPVPDAETAPLMTAFHRHLASGQPPPQALAAAQWQLHDTHPAATAAAAGFVCLGTDSGARSVNGQHRH